MSRYAKTILCGLTLLASAACSKEEKKAASATATATAPTAAPTAAAPVTPYVSEAEGMRQFVARCAPCHGREGKGDGSGSANLNPKPRNYTDKEWQKSVTDEQIEKTIMYGGAAVGKSPIMPASPELQSKPELVKALVKVIRGFGEGAAP